MRNILSPIVFFIILSAMPFFTVAQITSPSAAAEGTRLGIDYYVFCSSGPGSARGSLLANTPFGINSTFSWELYRFNSNTFEPFGTPNPNDTLSSEISNLSDGLYRVTVEAEGNTSTFDAWVLNNWIDITNTEIPDSTSNCEEFKIEADYGYAPLNIIDIDTGDTVSVRNPNIDFEISWTQGGNLIRSYISPVIYPPIASDSPVRYDLSVEDEFGCIAESFVDYESKVTEAAFDVNPLSGEAVLEVTFTNNSINYDSVYWFFYKDTYIISKQIEEAEGEPVDSVAFILHDDSPVYSYEMSGQYKVRLVTVKLNDTGNCYDTLYMDSFIDVDTTLIIVPNVFTPNGDGQNDYFIVRSTSLKSLDVKIYNRWGGLVHSWEYSNITSSDFTNEHSVWDGKIGNRMASPGVYYYVIRYEGRDIDRQHRRQRPKRGKETGFVHLFREK
jgi:gliding motility-associated-like protein